MTMAAYAPADDWNIWGTMLESQKSSPPSPSASHPSGPVKRPTLLRLPSKDSNSQITEKVQRRIICRLSRHTLRLERTYQLLKSIAALDPVGDYHTRGLQLLRLPKREGRDELALAALLYEDAGAPNELRALMNLGPGWFTVKQMPSVYQYNPEITSNELFHTGTISTTTFLRFAKGATDCCAFLHAHGMLHGEIRPE